MGLKDKYHWLHEPETNKDAKARMVSIGYTKSKGPGSAAQLWSISAMARLVGQ